MIPLEFLHVLGTACLSQMYKMILFSAQNIHGNNNDGVQD